MPEARRYTIHASCVSLDGYGVLLRGPSGSGKSDLAVRLIDGGALLVADDRVELNPRGGRAIATAPAGIRGLIEIRGLGIVRVAMAEEVALRLVVDLVPGRTMERMPESRSVSLCGVSLPVMSVNPFFASAPAAIRLAVGGLAASRTSSLTVVEV